MMRRLARLALLQLSHTTFPPLQHELRINFCDNRMENEAVQLGVPTMTNVSCLSILLCPTFTSKIWEAVWAS